MLAGRRVLVTGAGGSIGSEIAQQVAACNPGELLLLDHDESHLHDLAAVLRNEPAQVIGVVLTVGIIGRQHAPFLAAHLEHGIGGDRRLNVGVAVGAKLIARAARAGERLGAQSGREARQLAAPHL